MAVHDVYRILGRRSRPIMLNKVNFDDPQNVLTTSLNDIRSDFPPGNTLSLDTHSK